MDTVDELYRNLEERFTLVDIHKLSEQQQNALERLALLIITAWERYGETLRVDESIYTDITEPYERAILEMEEWANPRVKTAMAMCCFNPTRILNALRETVETGASGNG